jgi:aldose 1-epimerase
MANTGLTRGNRSASTFIAIAMGVMLPLIATAAANDARRSLVRTDFGRVGSDAISLYTLTNSHGIELKVMTYGAAIVSLRTPDRGGSFANVVLGFESLDPYLGNVSFYGATVGRFANRIASGRFLLDGTSYQLTTNDGRNSLHGGARGFDKRVWVPEIPKTSDGIAVRMTYVSPDGEEGYPGRMTAHVTYRLRDDDTLAIEFEATTTAPTPINLANHAYFNLTGDPMRSVLDHTLTLHADRFTPVDATLIPTGQLLAVAGTPFDFRSPEPIGARIGVADEQLRLGRGYDHNWALNKTTPRELALAATLTDPASGRVLEIRTTQPGIQFYSGNFLDGKPTGQGSTYGYRTGLCLETQHFPDSPNQPDFPSSILRPGQTYTESTVLAFRTVR